MSDQYPERLTSLHQWVVVGPDKIPLQPATRRRADTTDPTTWAHYSTAARVADIHKLNLGFVFTKASGIVGIDLDKCRDPETGIIEPWALAIVQTLNTLTEISFSGTGLHLLAEGELPEGRRKKGQIEMYDAGRHFLMTGNLLPGYETLRSRPVAIRRLHEDVFAQPEPASSSRPPAPSTPIDRDSETILALVEKTAKGRQLLSGDMASYPSQSEADQALCNLFVLAGADRSQADDLFRRSVLFREKWDQRRGEKTYGEKTLDKAFDGSVRPWSTFTPIVAAAPIRAASDDVSPGSDDTPCGQLGRENLRLRAELDQAHAEIARLRDENTVLVNLSINPHVKGKAPTIIRAANRYLHAKRAGQVDEDGFAPMSHNDIGDDFDNVENPILSGATVGRHLEQLAQEVRPDGTPLLERKKVTEPTQVLIKRNDGTPVVDPETGRRRTGTMPVERTWAKFTGDNLGDILRPFAYFRPPETKSSANDQAHAEPRAHGGDRRSQSFQESRTPCPDCGSAERVTYCKGCGVDISPVVEAEEHARFHHETRGNALRFTSCFQDGAHKYRIGGVVASTGFQDETRDRRSDEPDWVREAPVDSIAEAFLNARPMPGFEPSRLDRYTDGAIGGRQ